MHPSSVRRFARRGVVALAFVTVAVPGTALADPRPPTPEANVVPIVGNLSIATRDSDGHSVADGCVAPGTHRLLCFDFRTHNIGNADFVVGSPADRPDLFVESQSHGHYHLKDFNEFALFDMAGNPVVAGAKQAFCLMDSEHLSPWGPEDGRFQSCNTNQGISAGWADLYHKSLPCQFVVIDGVPDGTYVLRSTTNAQRIVSESSYSDNTIYTYLQLSGAHVTQLEGPPPWADTPDWEV
jgi:lysyl oxidase